MPAASNIVINDGAATPVAHTFSPIGKDEKGVLWFEQTVPTPTSLVEAKRIGYRQSRSTTAGSGGSKAVITVQVPKAETLGNSSAGLVPPPTLAYRTVVRMEFDLPERSALQERKDLRALCDNLLSNALVVNAIVDLQPIY